MDPVKRRAVLASTGVLALSGCAGISRNLPFVGNEAPEDDGEREVIYQVEETVEVPPDDHYVWKFESDSPTNISYEANADSSYDIDYMLMSEPNYQSYVDGEQYAVATHGTQTDTERASKSDIFAASHYHLVADNTDAGGAKPPDNADELDPPEVTMEIEAWI